MKILIASAHIRTPKGKLWRKLQWQFLKENTGVDFEYAIIASGVNPNLFPHADLVLQVPLISHSECIYKIIDLFTEREDFSHLLLLDSDAWPVRPWFKILTGLIGDRLYSAPMRVENYDDFPHPSAFFAKREALKIIDFGFAVRYNLLGIKISDVCSSMPQGEKENKLWVPLIKTNVWSPHPLFAAIYGDLFYHHGAGSRGLGVRMAGLRIYDHILKRPGDHRKIYNKLTFELKENPKKFINKLRGKDNGF